MFFALSAPADNTRGSRYMQEALAAFHQANCRRIPVTLIFACQDGRTGLYLHAPDDLAPLLVGPLKAKYPNCPITSCEDSPLSD